MAINLATGFSIGSKDVIDERQVLTLNQMQNLDESIYPDNYFAICKDNGKLYLFNASNEINAETGKFRVLSGGTGGGDTTYVLPPATDTTLGGVKVDNVTITVDSEGVITAINSYTKTEVDDLLNNKLDKPAVDGTAGQILVLQDDGSLAYADIPGSGNVDDIQEELDKKLDKPAVDGTAGQILVLQDDGSLAYEDNVGSGTADLSEINNKLALLESKRVYYSLEELNTAKGLSITLVLNEDNTSKIIDALSPTETFVYYFSNSTSSSRFGIDPNTYGTEISYLTMTKFNDAITIIRAFMANGKVLVRRSINDSLADWGYDKHPTPKTSVSTVTVNSKNFKIDISKVSSGLNGNIKFGYCVDNSYGEITIYSLGSNSVRWNHSTGPRYVNSVTYTIDPDNSTHITIGVEFYGVIYGVHQIETPSNFATINSFTGESYTGTSVATIGGIRGRNSGVGIIYDVADLGLTTPCTTVQIAQAMRQLAYGSSSIPPNSMIGIFDNGGGKISDAPLSYGLLQVNVTGADRVMIRYDGAGASSYAGSWIGQISAQSAGATFSGITWKRIDNVSTVDLTEINTKLTQLETKANSIPVITDNPTPYDLNEYKENGHYSIGAASQYANVPEVSSGMLLVFRSNTYRIQMYYCNGNNNVYYRTSTDWGSSWDNWKSLNTDLTDINDRLEQLENTTGGGNTNNDVYSTEEQAVGTWVNGKTLYRKTITGNSNTNSVLLYNNSADKVYIVKMEGIITLAKNSTNGLDIIYQLPFYDGKNAAYVSHNFSYGTVTSRLLYLHVTLSETDYYAAYDYCVSVYYYKN